MLTRAVVVGDTHTILLTGKTVVLEGELEFTFRRKKHCVRAGDASSAEMSRGI